VDDGSTDRSAALAEEWAGRHPRGRVLRHRVRSGFGAALRTGLAAARHPLFFYSTCDNQYEPADLKQLLDVIDQVHVVSGYRVQEGASGKPYRAGRGYRWLVRLLFGVRLRDIDCAFKLFRREIFARIPIQSNGRFVHAEILAKANFLGCLMGEAPVRYRPGPGGATAEASLRQTLAEAHRVFHHPDFGPAELLVKEERRRR
jgi:glycosyltransferase involved in cell wall biosynthesis